MGHWILLSVGHFGQCWWTVGEGLASSSLSLPPSIVCLIFLIFSKNQILVPLIFFSIIFNCIDFCSVFKIIFFILLALGLFCSFFSGYLRCKLKLLILDSSSFSVLACVCVCVCVCLCVLVAQSCLILCNPMDHSPPGSPVYGILQARTLEWLAIPFSISLGI